MSDPLPPGVIWAAALSISRSGEWSIDDEAAATVIDDRLVRSLPIAFAPDEIDELAERSSRLRRVEVPLGIAASSPPSPSIRSRSSPTSTAGPGSGRR